MLRRIVFVCGVVCLLFSAAGAQGRIGIISSHRPDVHLLRSTGQSQQTIYRASLEPNDQITTSPNGRLRLTLQDGTWLTMGESSSAKLLGGGSDQLTLRLDRGTLRMNVQAPLEIQNPLMIVRAANADFAIDASLPDTLRVICISGKVRIQTGNATFACGAGELVIAKSGESPRLPIPADDLLIARWQNITDPEQAPDFEPLP